MAQTTTPETETTDQATTDAARTKRYELLLILSGKVKDADVPAVVEDVKKVFSKHGAVVVDEKVWGRLKFAYELKHEKVGTYVLWHLDVATDKVRALDAELRVVEHVLRFLLIDNPKHGQVIPVPVQTPRDERGREPTGSRSDGRTAGAPRKPTSTSEAPAAPAKETSIDQTLDEILGDKTDKT